MYKRQLFINTSSKHFCEWLRKETSVYDKNTYPTENGYYQLRRAEYKDTFFETHKLMVIGGAYIFPKKAETQSSFGYEDLIKVSIQELGDNRLEVTFETHDEAVKSYIEKLIIKINHLWPMENYNPENNNEIKSQLLQITSEQKKIQEKLNRIYSGVQEGLIKQDELKSFLIKFEEVLLWAIDENNKQINQGDKEKILIGHGKLKSDLSLKQKLEITIPLIPLFVNYKVEIEKSTGININRLIDQISINKETNQKIAPNSENQDDEVLNKKKKQKPIIIDIQKLLLPLFLLFVFTLIFNYPYVISIIEKIFSVKTPSEVIEIYEEEHPTNTSEILIIIDESTPIPTLTEAPIAATPTSPTTTPSFTAIPSPTLTETITSAEISVNSSISIGVIRLKDECWDEDTKERKDGEIIDRLSSLGFSVSSIGLSSDYYTLSQYDVVYIPQGWYCQMDEIKSRVNQLQEFTRVGGGLLIGNPDISREEFNFEIFQTIFTYKPNLRITNDFPPEIIEHKPPRTIIKDLSYTDFPLPENSIKPNFYNNIYAISKGSKSQTLSFLIVDPYFSGRAVFITGGELLESPHPLNNQMWVRILYWLTYRIE